MKQKLLSVISIILLIVSYNKSQSQNNVYFHEGFTNNPGTFNSTAPTDASTLPITYEKADSGTWAVYGFYRTTGSPCTGLEAGHLRSIKTAAGSGRIPFAATPVLNFGVKEFHFIPGNGNNKSFVLQKTVDTAATSSNWVTVATFVADNCGGTTPDTAILVNDATTKRLRIVAQENYQVDLDSVFITSFTTILPVRFTAINAIETSGKIKVSWNTATEANISRYVIERSSNGISFEEVATLLATQSTAYTWVDNAPLPGNNLYRIKAVDKDGSLLYTNIVKIAIGKRLAELTIAPNPVKGGLLNLQLNNYETGKYDVSLINSQGQQVFNGSINHAGGSATQSLQLPASVKAGIYTLRMHNGTGITNRNVVIE